MKKFILKFLLSLLNIVWLGSGFAVTQKLRKALFLQFTSIIIYALGGFSGLFSNFYGFAICYSLIFLIYAYSFISSWFIKNPQFGNWKSNLLKYLAAVLIMKLIFVLPIRAYYFEPRKNNQEYFMTDKRRDNKPLYIFWSNDLSIIGKNISK